MDFDALSEAYQQASKGYKPVVNGDTLWKPPTPSEAVHNIGGHDVEVDYSIVKMSDTSYIVARSRYLGSLDYDFLCHCESRHEAREIVRALSK